MTFGSKKTFALSYEIVPSAGTAILGCFGMWAIDAAIGDSSDIFVLTTTQAVMEDLLRSCGKRNDPYLADASKEDALRTLQESLYGTKNLGNADALSLKYSEFDLTALGNTSFDEFFVFLIETPVGERLLWRKRQHPHVSEALLPPNTFENVARAYLREFSADVQRARK